MEKSLQLAKNLFAVVLLVLVSLSANAQDSAEAKNSNKALVSAFFEQVYNQKNHQFVLDNFSSNYYEHREGGARSNQGALFIIKIAESIFPDLKVKVEDIVEDNGIVAVRLTFSATHKGNYMGVEATNKHITWEAMEFFKVKDGKISDSWGCWPNYDIIEMLKAPVK